MDQNGFNERMQHFRAQMHQQQQRGPVQRIFAWLLLGLVLIIGLTLLVVSLLLSWLLIPLMLYRGRQRRRAEQQARASSSDGSQRRHSQVIEGEIVDKDQ